MGCPSRILIGTGSPRSRQPTYIFDQPSGIQPENVKTFSPKADEKRVVHRQVSSCKSMNIPAPGGGGGGCYEAHEPSLSNPTEPSSNRSFPQELEFR